MTIPIHNPTGLDPALMTFDEYAQAVNRSGKFHPSDAYDFTLAKMNEFGKKREEYEHLLRQITVKGMRFEIRLSLEPRVYSKRDEAGEYVRSGDAIATYSPEEIREMGLREHDYALAIFNEDGERVALVDDEWGALLVAVAQEYRGFGFGPLLTRLARTFEPTKDSGGFTEAGYRNLSKVHRSFVRDALTSGRYATLVRGGKLSMERLREIVGSAKLSLSRKKPDTENLSSSNPSDWLLYVDQHADLFILYDKKLPAVLDAPDRDHFVDRMLKGMVDVFEFKKGLAYLRAFGGDTPKIKQLMIMIAVSHCEREGLHLYLEPGEIEIAQTIPHLDLAAPDVKTGARRALATWNGGPLPDYRSFAPVEAAFRRTFDRYDEFFHNLLERAYAKFRD